MGKKVLIADRALMMRKSIVKGALESGGYEQDSIRRDTLAAGAKGMISKNAIHPPQRLLDELEKALNA